MPVFKIGIARRGQRRAVHFSISRTGTPDCRLLRALVDPGSIPGSTMGGCGHSKSDYSKLDEMGSAVRVRLNSTVVQVQHSNAAKEVQVGYVRGGKLPDCRRKVNCVLGLPITGMIPYLCPELRRQQRRSAVVSRESAAGLHARGAAELDFICQT